MNPPLIVIDPDIQSGTPVFAGTRVPVQNLFDHLAEGDSLNVFLAQFPSISRDQAVAVLQQAQTALMSPWQGQVAEFQRLCDQVGLRAAHAGMSEAELERLLNAPD